MLKISSLPSAAFVGVKAAAAMLAIQACSVGSVMAQSASAPISLEGVWESTVTAKDCASGAALGPPFKALIVFRRGSTFDVDSAQGGAQGRAQRSNIYGTWKRVSGSAYVADAVHQRFNPDGSYAGNNMIQRSLTLSADGAGFTSAIKVQILDLNGNVLNEVCPTEVAVRMSL